MYINVRVLRCLAGVHWGASLGEPVWQCVSAKRSCVRACFRRAPACFAASAVGTLFQAVKSVRKNTAWAKAVLGEPALKSRVPHLRVCYHIGHLCAWR